MEGIGKKEITKTIIYELFAAHNIVGVVCVKKNLMDGLCNKVVKTIEFQRWSLTEVSEEPERGGVWENSRLRKQEMEQEKNMKGEDVTESTWII